MKPKTPFQIVGGGLKAAGKAISGAVASGARKLASPLVRELKMQDAADIKNKADGKALNEAYSGPATPKFKYGYNKKKN